MGYNNNHREEFFMRTRRGLYTALAVAMVLVFGIVIAYAALSTSLNAVFSGVTQSALTWNVGFNGTSATPSSNGTSSTGRTCGTATISSSAVTVGSTSLSKPGDKCTYTLTIKNSGSVGATIGSVTPTKPTGTGVSCTTASGGKMVCGNITYTLATNSSGTTLLSSGSNLSSGSSLTVYLIVEYTGSSLSSSSKTQSGGKFSITYNQA